MLWGLILITLLYFVARYVGLNTLTWILGNFLSVIVLVVVIIFQDEIRRGLTKVGMHRFFAGLEKPRFSKTGEDIALVVEKLSKDKLGALIVIQGRVGLDEFVEESVVLDAVLDRKLLYSLFVKDSALHDGAVLIEGRRIKAAGCVLPLSFNPDLDPSLGTRHRAALGLSERSDAFIIVVSEENGAVSLVRDGRLIRNVDVAVLRGLLEQALGVNSGVSAVAEVGG